MVPSADFGRCQGMHVITVWDIERRCPTPTPWQSRTGQGPLPTDAIGGDVAASLAARDSGSYRTNLRNVRSSRFPRLRGPPGGVAAHFSKRNGGRFETDGKQTFTVGGKES